MRHPSSQPDEAGHEAGPAARARGLLARRQEVRSRPRYPSGPSPGRQPWRGQIKSVSPGRTGEARRGEARRCLLGRGRGQAAAAGSEELGAPRGAATGTRPPPPPFCGRAPPAALGPPARSAGCRGGLRGRARPSLSSPPLPSLPSWASAPAASALGRLSPWQGRNPLYARSCGGACPKLSR